MTEFDKDTIKCLQDLIVLLEQGKVTILSRDVQEEEEIEGYQQADFIMTIRSLEKE